MRPIPAESDSVMIAIEWATDGAPVLLIPTETDTTPARALVCFVFETMESLKVPFQLAPKVC